MSRTTRRLADNPDEIRSDFPIACEACGGAFSSDDAQELIGEYDEVELPPISLMLSATGASPVGAGVGASKPRGRRLRSRRRRHLGRASTRWPFISRVSKRYPTSGCAVCSVTLSV
jgi:hypothetical protein